MVALDFVGDRPRLRSTEQLIDPVPVNDICAFPFASTSALPTRNEPGLANGLGNFVIGIAMGSSFGTGYEISGVGLFGPLVTEKLASEPFPVVS